MQQFAAKLRVWTPDGDRTDRMGARGRALITATYDYRDEDGTVLSQVVRFEPKDFRQRRPDGNGGWLWSLDGVRRVPYRLPELLAAIRRGERIFVVEGEKDVEALVAHGFEATTNASGAGKWQDEHSVYLTGARVIVLPDNDTAGKEHGRQVAQSLKDFAVEIKTVTLPGLPPKGDVSDWFAQGHTPDELERFVEVVSPWRPPSSGLPEEAFVGIAADFANLYSSHTESPRSFLFFTFLTYLGALVAHRVTLRCELRPSPRLYTVCLGPSADGRKSASLGHVRRFFHDSVAGFGDQVHYGLGSAEGLARRLGRDPRTKVTRPPLLVHLDEMRVLPDKARLEGSVLLPMLSTLFEDTAYDNTTKTRTISIRDGYLSIAAACTMETYATIWTPAFVDIGFTNRLWLVVGESTCRVALPHPVPEECRQAIARTFGDLLTRIDHAAGTGPLLLALDPDAEQSWEAWYGAMPRTIHSRRLDAYGWRLMILLSLSRGDIERVSADTVRRVCLLLDDQLALRQQFDPIDAEGTVAKLEELIRRVLRTHGPLSERDLRRKTNGDRHGLWAFQMAVRNLTGAGDVAVDRMSKRVALTEEGLADA